MRKGMRSRKSSEKPRPDKALQALLKAVGGFCSFGFAMAVLEGSLSFIKRDSPVKRRDMNSIYGSTSVKCANGRERKRELAVFSGRCIRILRPLAER